MLKCPFCGNENLEIARKNQGLHGENGAGYIVRCNYLNSGCGANGGSRPTEEDAIKAWNQRVTEINNFVDELEAMIKKYQDESKKE